GTVNVVAAAAAAGVRRYVHMSALGAREGARSRYHQTKWAAEEAVRACALPWTIFRPSVIYGRGDGFVSPLVRLVRRLPVVPLLMPKQDNACAPASLPAAFGLEPLPLATGLRRLLG